MQAIVIELADGTVKVDGPYSDADGAFAFQKLVAQLEDELGIRLPYEGGHDTPTAHGEDHNGDDVFVYLVPLAPSVEVGAPAAQGTWIWLSGHDPKDWSVEVCLDDPPCTLCDQRIDGVRRKQAGWTIHTASPVCEECVTKYQDPDPDRPPVG